MGRHRRGQRRPDPEGHRRKSDGGKSSRVVEDPETNRTKVESGPGEPEGSQRGG